MSTFLWLPTWLNFIQNGGFPSRYWSGKSSSRNRFLTINFMGTMEVSSKKLDLNAYVNGTKPTKNREQCHLIRIGILHHSSPRKIEMQKDSDGRLIAIPPWLNGLRIKQQSFRQFTEQYKWNYILENTCRLVALPSCPLVVPAGCWVACCRAARRRRRAAWFRFHSIGGGL